MKKILLIGDSISLYYVPFLADALSHTAEIHTKEGIRQAMTDLDRPIGGNGGDSSMVLSYLRERAAAGTLSFNLFAFNCGLHDIKRAVPAETLNISPEQYRDNLSQIYAIAKNHRLKTVFINSTAVDDGKHNVRVSRLGFKRYNADLKQFNAIAEQVAKTHSVPVIDLYGFTDSLPGTKYMDHVHFHMDIRKRQAEFLAQQLAKYL